MFSRTTWDYHEWHSTPLRLLHSLQLLIPNCTQSHTVTYTNKRLCGRRVNVEKHYGQSEYDKSERRKW